MVDELERLISGEGEKPEDPKAEEKSEAPQKSEIEIKEEERLSNLRKAADQARSELQDLRKKKKAEKAGTELEDELPRINEEDPSVRAWDKRFNDKVNPLAQELEKEKAEVENLALKEFLSEKPSLARNPEKVKELVRDYEALSKARGITGRNKDVVRSVIESAYGSIFHEEILNEARQRRVEAVRAESLLADVATDEGASSFRQPKASRPQLSKDEVEVATKMYGSVEEYYQAMEKLVQ